MRRTTWTTKTATVACWWVPHLESWCSGTRLRALPLREEEVAAHQSAFLQFQKWAAVASPESSIEALAKGNVPLLSDLLGQHSYQAREE